VRGGAARAAAVGPTDAGRTGTNLSTNAAELLDSTQGWVHDFAQHDEPLMALVAGHMEVRAIGSDEGALPLVVPAHALL
jgi:hypothetical protein